MVNSLGNQGYCTSKSIFRVLGVIGHFYNDVKYAEVSAFFLEIYLVILMKPVPISQNARICMARVNTYVKCSLRG